MSLSLKDLRGFLSAHFSAWEMNGVVSNVMCNITNNVAHKFTIKTKLGNKDVYFTCMADPGKIVYNDSYIKYILVVSATDSYKQEHEICHTLIDLSNVIMTLAIE